MGHPGVSTGHRWAIAVLLLASTAYLAPAPAKAAVGSISGKVTRLSDSAPVSGARVCAEQQGGGLEFDCTSTVVGGGYEFSPLPPGEYLVEFSRGESESNLAWQYYDGASRRRDADPVTVVPGVTRSGVDAALAAGGAITGRVAAAGSGAPLAGVFVCSYFEAQDLDGCTETGSNGGYEISGLPAGLHQVEFWAFSLGYETQFYSGRPSFSEADPVSVSAGGTRANVNASLTLAGLISGHVYDPGGLLGYVPPPAGSTSASPPVATPRPHTLRCKRGYVKKRLKGRKPRCVRRHRHHHHRHH